MSGEPAVETEQSYAWKFVITAKEWIPLVSNPKASFKGCLAVVIARTLEEAKTTIQIDAAEHGEDSRWLEIATVRRIDLIQGRPQLLGVAYL